MDWSTLHWPGGAPWWALLLAAAALGWALVRRHRDLTEKLPPGRVWLLQALRGLLYAAIVFFLSVPTLIDRRERSLPPKLLVLIDSSASMSVRDANEKRTRIRLARDFLLAPGDGERSRAGGAEDKEEKGERGGDESPPGLLSRLRALYDVHLVRYDADRAPIGLGELKNLQAVGSGSDPLGAIRGVLRSVEGAPSAAAGGGERRTREGPLGILMLSDGGDTTGAVLPPEDVKSFPPLIGVGFGAPESFRDIAIQDVQAPRIAFQGKEVRLEVSLSVKGFSGRKLPVALTREGRIVRTQSIDVRRGPLRRLVEFRFTPNEVGSQVLRVVTPVQRGEIVESNNRVEIPLEIRRDKIRILTISGAPTWNYRFLRMALKRDPAIDLVSFVFLRTSEDDPGVPTQNLSLVPFPVDKLFLEELKNFEIVVFDNFSTQEYFSNYYLERVRDYVRKGGALLMFGGRRSFSAGGYYRTPIEDVLPVRLRQANDYEDQRSLRFALTPTGGRHPVTRLSSDLDENRKLWTLFPPLRRVNVTTPFGRGQVLLATKGGGVPLIAAKRVGEGRVLSIFSDDTWRWNFGMVAAERTNRLYIRMVAQMVRWLSGDPGSSQVQIFPEAEQARDGMYVLRMQVRDASYQPAQAAQVQVSLRDPYGVAHQYRAAYRPDSREFEIRFRPRGNGSYQARMKAAHGGRVIGEAVRTIAVGREAGKAEWADVSPRWENLRALAKGTGGLFFRASALGGEDVSARVLEALKGKVPHKVMEVRDVRLWSVPWVGMILILLPGVEWTLRRLWGLA